MPPIFISAIIETSRGKFLNLAHYFPYDVKLRLWAHSRSFLANQKARNAIVGAENLLKLDRTVQVFYFLNIYIYIFVFICLRVDSYSVAVFVGIFCGTDVRFDPLQDTSFKSF